MIHFWYSISISINDTFQVYQYHKSLIHDCDTFTTDVKKDSCRKLFIHSVRNCKSNSDNAAYSDKLCSWRWYLWLRHNRSRPTINWRNKQCCWQPDRRKCIKYLSAQELEMLARYSRIWKVFVKFITTLPSSAPVIDCSAQLDRSKCHAATISNHSLF